MSDYAAPRRDTDAYHRLGAQFQSIVDTLWTPFETVDRIRDIDDVFVALCAPLARALGATGLFMARPTGEGVSTFRVIAWYGRGGSRRPHGAFSSVLLGKAVSSADGSGFWDGDQLRSTEKGPLSTLWPNMGVVRIRFSSDRLLCIGACVRRRAASEETWTGTEKQLLCCFPELLAAPLRIENEFRERKLFEKISVDALPAEMERIGHRMLVPRIELAWLAKDVRASRTNPTLRAPDGDLPIISGDYDPILARYLDARRHCCARGDMGRSVASDSVLRFARLFDPSPTGLSMSIDGQTERHTRYRLGARAELARYAAARGLIWLAYKHGILNGLAGSGAECPLPTKSGVHQSCPRKNPLCVQFASQVLSPSASSSATFVGDACPHASRLRCLWLDVYYRARDLTDNRGPHTHALVKHLAGRYAVTAAETADFLRKALGTLSKDTGGSDGIHIDWQWLYLWFLAKAFGSRALSQRYGGYDRARHGLDAHLTYFLRSATAAAFGLQLLTSWRSPARMELADIPELRPHELVQSRVHLLSQFAHWEIGVDPAWELSRHLGLQFQSEMALYASSSGHRDHTFHAMDVCLLGHAILESASPSGSRSRLAAALLGGTTVKQMLRAWYPAALLHDVGYGLSLASRVPELLLKFRSTDIKQYRDDVMKGVAEAHRILDERVEGQLTRAGLTWAEPRQGISRDHGVVTVGHLVDTLASTAGDSFLKKSATRASLQAILRHNRRAEVVDVTREPLSFLLFLCDHLQEWGRSRARPELAAQAFLMSLQISSAFAMETEPGAECLVLSGRYHSRRGGLVLSGKPIKFGLQFGPARWRLAEPAAQWVDMCADCERVKLPKGFPPMEILSVHPMSSTVRQAMWPASEMQLLHDFSSTEAGGFLRNWLNSVDSCKCGMRYLMDAKGECESFSLRLLGGEGKSRRLLTGIPKGFFGDFVEWKERKLFLVPEG